MQMFQTLGRTMEPSDVLKIECVACGHRVEWTRAEAFARLGAGARPADLKRLGPCGKCGERRRIRAWI